MRAWSHVQSGIRSLDRQHWFWATIIGLVVIAITSVIDFGHLSNPSKIGWGVNLLGRTPS